MVPVKQQAANAQDEIQKYTEMKTLSSCPYLLIIRRHFPANERKKKFKNFTQKHECEF